MPLTPAAPARTHEVHLRLGPAGQPLAVRHDGRIRIADPDTDSQHRFTGDTEPVGAGKLVDIESWRVQVRLGSSISALRTFELRRDPLSEQWLLESITDN